MKTNRQWLEQMSDRDLARFLTNGTEVRVIGCPLGAVYLSIRQIAHRYTSSALGIEEWLSQEQEYELAQQGGKEKEMQELKHDFVVDSNKNNYIASAGEGGE